MTPDGAEGDVVGEFDGEGGDLGEALGHSVAALDDEIAQLAELLRRGGGFGDGLGCGFGFGQDLGLSRLRGFWRAPRRAAARDFRDGE